MLNKQELKDKKKELKKLKKLRSVIEKLNDVRVIAISQGLKYDITEFCPLDFSTRDMQPVIENLEDAIVILRCDIEEYNSSDKED